MGKRKYVPNGDRILCPSLQHYKHLTVCALACPVRGGNQKCPAFRAQDPDHIERVLRAYRAKKETEGQDKPMKEKEEELMKKQEKHKKDTRRKPTHIFFPDDERVGYYTLAWEPSMLLPPGTVYALTEVHIYRREDGATFKDYGISKTEQAKEKERKQLELLAEAQAEDPEVIDIVEGTRIVADENYPPELEPQPNAPEPCTVAAATAKPKEEKQNPLEHLRPAKGKKKKGKGKKAKPADKPKKDKGKPADKPADKPKKGKGKPADKPKPAKSKPKPSKPTKSKPAKSKPKPSKPAKSNETLAQAFGILLPKPVATPTKKKKK